MVGILVALVALLAVGGKSILESTKGRAAKAQMERLKLYLEEYRAFTGEYPPDGIDSTVENEDGVELRGCAALYHALTTPIQTRVMRGGIPQEIQREPIAEFQESELTPPNLDYPGVREIVDPFGFPIHYDNTLDGMFRPQRGEVHYPPVSDAEHAPDPRTRPLDEGGVRYPGRVQSQGFDLWSYGRQGDVPVEERQAPIATWNLNE